MSSAITRRRMSSARVWTRESRLRCGWERSASLMPQTSDVLVLARLQFAFTISAHIIFPAISIGLANYLAVLEGLWLRTGKLVYRELFFFWSKIFAVGFGMGVVSGVVMSYEFGANWAGFSRVAGSVNGPLLTYEVLTAFFLEAGFLGIMLFGWKRVGARLHFLATALVALGTLFSTFWILASNSWMQTPQGFHIVDGRVVPLDWLKIVFNPSFPFRLVHMSLAAFIVAATIVAGCAAWHLLHGRSGEGIRKSFSIGGGHDPRGRADPDDRWGSARPQYARAPTRQDRCDRRALGNREGWHRTESRRVARHAGGANEIRRIGE